jgi:hypothetical protein
MKSGIFKLVKNKLDLILKQASSLHIWKKYFSLNEGY